MLRGPLNLAARPLASGKGRELPHVPLRVSTRPLVTWLGTIQRRLGSHVPCPWIGQGRTHLFTSLREVYLLGYFQSADISYLHWKRSAIVCDSKG